MNLHWQRLPLEVTDPKASIKACKPLHDHLENRDPFSAKQEEAMLQALNLGIDSPVWTEIQKKLTQKHCVPVLEHDDAQILSLPWRLATMPGQTGNLHTQHDLHLARTLSKVWNNTPFVPDIAPPLRVLVVISSPADTEQHRRLSYEDEEMQIQQAFLPLLEKGLVQLDFAEDGCLETLASRIKARPYHIVHYSGHGTFRDGQGLLEMEDFITLKKRLVSGQEFAAALKSNPSHKVPLVVLNSCQTGMGSSDTEELRGLSLRLVEMGIPAVIGMGASVIDKFATDFAAKLYQEIASQQPLPTAFSASIRYIQTTEQAYRNSRGAGVARQYLIPQLYLSCPIEQLADWSKAPEEVTYDSVGFLNLNRLSDTKFQQEANQKFLFIGRRKEKRALLPPLIASQPVMLLGQGGLGKTSLAGHLVTRLISYEPKTQPFFFDETSFSVTKVQQEIEFWLEDHLPAEQYNNWQSRLDRFKEREGEDPAIGHLRIHLRFLNEVSQPVFLFDNLESFQSEPGGGRWKEDSQAELDLLVWLINEAQVRLILTGRYPIPELSAVLTTVNLNTVSLGDFRKKIQTMQLGTLVGSEMFTKKEENVSLSIHSFDDFVKFLHTGMGGSYQALEWVDVLYQEQQEQGLLNTLPELAKFATEQSISVRQDMAENLVFDKLLELLTEAHHQILGWLQHFTIPVQPLALALQGADRDSLPELLDRLHRLTIVERHDNPVLGDTWYLAPLSRELWEAQAGNSSIIDAGKTAAYHFGIHENYYQGDVWREPLEAQAAYDWYLKAPDAEPLSALGFRFSNMYYRMSRFHLAFQYASATVDLLQQESVAQVLNVLGLLLKMFGKGAEAEPIYQLALRKFQEIGDKSGESTTLNNISGIYRARGDYQTALSYLEQSLAIRREIGDKSGEGTTLNNISQIYDARGDYQTALSYLEKSLAIQQEIGDKSGEGTTLNNISQIYSARGDYQTALAYLEQSLAIQQQIGDKSGEGTTLNNISTIYSVRGDYQTALSYLEQSLAIRREIGDKSGEGTTLNNISQIYNARGDYQTALSYLKQSLAIQQQIGDKSGEGTTLNNISTIYSVRGDYQTALSYLEQSLAIRREIGDKSGEGTTLSNISQIYSVRGDYQTALSYLEQSLAICREIGNKSGESTTLGNIGNIHLSQGDYDLALSYFKKDLAICREIGDKSGEGITLSNISQIYSARGDYQTALSYLEQSLAIRREIGDKSGMVATLHNIATNHLSQENVEGYFQFEVQAFQLAQEIGNAQGLYKVGRFLGGILFNNGGKEQSIPFLEAANMVASQNQLPDAEELAQMLQEARNTIT